MKENRLRKYEKEMMRIFQTNTEDVREGWMLLKVFNNLCSSTNAIIVTKSNKNEIVGTCSTYM